jgi:hypothetical protein
VIARARTVAFVGWRGTPRAEDVAEWHRLGTTLEKAHPRSTACVDLVLTGTPSFTEDVRREAQSLAADRGIFHLGFVHVLLMPGFAGVAVRGFIGTILHISRPHAPTKVVGSIADASSWLAPKLSAQGWTERELAETCEELVTMLRS